MKTIKVRLNNRTYAVLAHAAKSWGHKRVGTYVAYEICRQMSKVSKRLPVSQRKRKRLPLP